MTCFVGLKEAVNGELYPHLLALKHVISCQHPVTFETLTYHCELERRQIGFLCHLICPGIDSSNCRLTCP